MLGRLRVRGKLAVVVALPLVAVALLTLPGVLGAIDRAQRADEIGRKMQAAIPVTSLVNELQQERLLALGYLFDLVGRGALSGQATQVSDRMVDVRHDAPPAYLRHAGTSPALAGADALTGMRSVVLARQVSPEEVINAYGAAIAGLIDSLRLVDEVDLATPAARHAAALDASLRANEAAAQTADLLLVIAATGSQQASAMYVASILVAGEHTNRFSQYASQEQLALVGLMREAYTTREQTGSGVAFNPDPSLATGGRTAAELFPSLESLRQLGRFVETKVITDVRIEVDEQSQAELRTAYLVALGALLVVLIVVVLTAVLARAVVRPLLNLTGSANRVARVADAELARIADEEVESAESVNLDPVRVNTRDEIGDLGRAFNRVQSIAVRLVERQLASRRNVALMFGYLGRRTQNLVSRQLALIDQLERNETSSERLGHLYRLDHISSRLRRNAGSLVVLSGSTSADEHVAPLPLTDLVRLSLGEIEDYGRVDVSVPASIMLVPSVIGDLVLVLAELMENATVFSPPHTRVLVSAATFGTGTGAAISIVDRGIGMSPDRLAEENSRLARRERLDLAPTEVLGLFVVGRLSRRHGLRVMLSATPGGGVTAVVEIDQRLLVAPEPPPRAVTAVLPGHPAIATPERTLIPAVPDRRRPSTFDAGVLSRASQTLQAGRAWNAFALPSGPASIPEPAGPLAPPVPGAAPAAMPVPGPAVPGSAVPATPAVAEPAIPAPAIPAVPLGNGPVAGSRRLGLRRRVPGASLAAEAVPSPIRRGPAAASSVDPDQARDLVEQLEAGVNRALSEIRSGSDVTQHDRKQQDRKEQNGKENDDRE